MNETASIFFLKQRAEWMLKAPTPEKYRIEMEMTMDRNKNPHNDSYKPKLRSEAEIIADLAASFADQVLTQTYGYGYKSWLTRVTTAPSMDKGVDVSRIFVEENGG